MLMELWISLFFIVAYKLPNLYKSTWCMVMKRVWRSHSLELWEIVIKSTSAVCHRAVTNLQQRQWANFNVNSSRAHNANTNWTKHPTGGRDLHKKAKLCTHASSKRRQSVCHIEDGYLIFFFLICLYIAKQPERIK